jgi:cobalamin-dependent methionine synthase I
MQSPQKETLERLIHEVLSLWKPGGVVRQDRVLRIEDHGIVTEHLELPGRTIAERFRGSAQISCMAVTAGPEAMRWKEKFHESGEIALEVMADAVLSELVDQLMDDLNRLTGREAAIKGYGLTMRYSPGYGDFPLSFQKILLDFLGAERIGIVLNPSFIMVPEKSVTAVTGWIKKSRK